MVVNEALEGFVVDMALLGDECVASRPSASLCDLGGAKIFLEIYILLLP